MFDVDTLAILIPALPLAATLVTALFGKRVLRERSHIPVIAAFGLALVASVAILVQIRREAHVGQAFQPDSRFTQTLHHNGSKANVKVESPTYERIVTLWTWASIPNAHEPTRRPSHAAGQENGDFRVAITLRADPLSAVMLVTVTLISLIVAIYSVGYMHGDPGYWRFFTYIALFVFSMTMLVSVSNFALLYVFWEGVGLCSYLLIGFWFEKPAAAAAGKKAFLVNRVGDFGFALGVFLIWVAFGTLDFHDTSSGASIVSRGVLSTGLIERLPELAPGLVTAICLLLFLGACGKSAQLPLHVWLPDAMEGPTPVSALIHAATMVTAGVYLVARCSPLFAASPDAQCVVASIGGLTALVAAIIAMTQTDLKRILAYSTISQLGYMFLALGAGTAIGVVAAMFHLVTHAVFKALLFLAAGSVMHAMGGVVDLRRLGGLRRRMPVTCWTFLFGSLALAGVAPLAGFWSKDAILAAIHERAGSSFLPTLYQWLYVVALATAGLTAFYTFRAFFLTFFGKERIPPEAGHHVGESLRDSIPVSERPVHVYESPLVMTLPLVVLAVGSVVVGMVLEMTGSLRNLLAMAPPIASLGGLAHGAEAAATHWMIAVTSTVVVLMAIAAAWLVYLAMQASLPWLTTLMRSLGLYGLSAGKFFFDPIYQSLVVGPLEGLSRLSAWCDGKLIDRLVDLLGAAPRGLGGLVRPMQGGLLQFYAAAMVVGLLATLGILMIW